MSTMTWLNHQRKLCPGCATMRSDAQFNDGSDYCLICSRHGISTPKVQLWRDRKRVKEASAN